MVALIKSLGPWKHKKVSTTKPKMAKMPAKITPQMPAATIDRPSQTSKKSKIHPTYSPSCPKPTT
jgi:hypothetical protein